MGQNPTSGILSLARRRQIYALCSQYDIIIIEDDPYWFLQYPTATVANTQTSTSSRNTSAGPNDAIFANAELRPAGWKSSGYEFVDSLVPSYVNIDVDGRVVRLDTFSKTIAPGCRLGWITAQPALIERLARITETSSAQPSGFVQGMVAKLLLGPDHDATSSERATPIPHSKGRKGGGSETIPSSSGWKTDGWVRWLAGLRGNYERRMNTISQILDSGKYMFSTTRRHSLDLLHSDSPAASSEAWALVDKIPMYNFTWPAGGMFLWLHILFETHPLYTAYQRESGLAGLATLSRALWVLWTTPPYLVLVQSGLMFSPTDTIAERHGWQYFRLCFAAIDEDDLAPTAQHLADGTAAFWRIRDRETIEKLVEQSEEHVAASAPRLANLATAATRC